VSLPLAALFLWRCGVKYLASGFTSGLHSGNKQKKADPVRISLFFEGGNLSRSKIKILATLSKLYSGLSIYKDTTESIMLQDFFKNFPKNTQKP